MSFCSNNDNKIFWDLSNFLLLFVSAFAISEYEQYCVAKYGYVVTIFKSFVQIWKSSICILFSGF